jgi:hypothetical protein
MFDPSQFKLIADTFYEAGKIESRERFKIRCAPKPYKSTSGPKVKPSTIEAIRLLASLGPLESVALNKTPKQVQTIIKNVQRGKYFRDLDNKEFRSKRTSSTTCLTTRIS